MTLTARYGLYEKVVVRAAPASASIEVDGATGTVLGRVQSETGEWAYAVCLHRDQSCRSILEEELDSLGGFDDPAGPASPDPR